MIRNEHDYQGAVHELHLEKNRLADHRSRLEKEQLSTEAIQRVLDPLISFQAQLQEEIEAYERFARGEFSALVNLYGLEQTLIALRIKHGLTQLELAERLGVHVSQVARDERNEYHGVTIERARKILDAMGLPFVGRFEPSDPGSQLS